MRTAIKLPVAKKILAALGLMLLGANAAWPAEDEKALQAALTLLNQEQQAIFQQFQMIQQLRRSNAEPVLPAIGGGPPGNYDDMTATRRAQADREEAYARESRELYQRHRDLEREKQPIIESLRRLRQAPGG
jgi:hypothetical protein